MVVRGPREEQKVRCYLVSLGHGPPVVHEGWKNWYQKQPGSWRRQPGNRKCAHPEARTHDLRRVTSVGEVAICLVAIRTKGEKESGGEGAESGGLRQGTEELEVMFAALQVEVPKSRDKVLVRREAWSE